MRRRRLQHGACTVILDGDVCCACLVGAGQEGSEITTVEGLINAGSLSGLQKAFLKPGQYNAGSAYQEC